MANEPNNEGQSSRSESVIQIPWYSSQCLSSFFSNVNPCFSDGWGLWRRYGNMINKITTPLTSIDHLQMGHQNYFTRNPMIPLSMVQIIPPFMISRSNFTQIVIGLISTFPTMTTLSMDIDRLPLIRIPQILLYLIQKNHGTHFVPAWILRLQSLLWILTSTNPRQRRSYRSSSAVSRIQRNTH